MGIILIFKLIKIVVGLIFLKNIFNKITKPVLFYKAIQEYTNFKDYLLQLLIPLLISLEFTLVLFLFLDIYTQTVVIIGVIVQVFYLTLIFSNMNTSFTKNCGCFELNTPKEVTVKHLAINLLILLFFFSIFGIHKIN